MWISLFIKHHGSKGCKQLRHIFIIQRSSISQSEETQVLHAGVGAASPTFLGAATYAAFGGNCSRPFYRRYIGITHNFYELCDAVKVLVEQHKPKTNHIFLLPVVFFVVFVSGNILLLITLPHHYVILCFYVYLHIYIRVSWLSNTWFIILHLWERNQTRLRKF